MCNVEAKISSSSSSKYIPVQLEDLDSMDNPLNASQHSDSCSRPSSKSSSTYFTNSTDEKFNKMHLSGIKLKTDHLEITISQQFKR